MENVKRSELSSTGDDTQAGLEHELKEFIIKTLALEDISPEEIDNESRLFGEGLGLDSIDALELGVALQKHYGVKIDANAEQTREHFSSVRNLAALVSQQRKT